MVLEATMIVPSRFEAQSDAVSLIFSAKTQANPESSVGLMSMGGKGPEVLVTLTTDYGKILDGLHRTKIRGNTHLTTGIQVAGLALKHRQNKSQRQRIIVFICSPIEEDEKTLVKLAKKMKKNNISIDFVIFGDIEEDNTNKLTAFNENVKSGDGSHLAIIPPGPNLLSDSLLTTPILSGEGIAGVGRSGDGDGGEGGPESYEFGVDPSMDPELALALRMSYEEEKARIEKEKEKEKEKERLEGIREEDENSPLLSKDKKEGEGEGSASSSSDKKNKDDDPDKMDTA
ncbi:hypothetical protein FGG08_004568 [Glutinoglossum americanum]|uniref:VWFA domain-containing protein n=1 Tax=Glutinoglossum americanum TaxID=1670608 RepID=A0A9P8I023_9PEZI|nr:hypothetical protein FGG08_004568 [Glutinoglossum americanum]